MTVIEVPGIILCGGCGYVMAQDSELQGDSRFVIMSCRSAECIERNIAYSIPLRWCVVTPFQPPEAA